MMEGILASSAWPLLFGGCVVALISGVLRGFSGFGFALVASPLLALLMPPKDAVPVVLLLQFGSSLMGARQSLLRWDREASVLIMIAAIVTTPVGVALLHFIDPRTARIAMALITLSAVALLATGRLALDLSGRWKALPFGLAAGIFGGASAMPGPPVIAYFMARDTPPSVGRASMNLIFMATSTVAIAANMIGGALSGSSWLLAALCAPAMILGTAVGSWMFERSSPAVYRPVGLIALVIVAVIALSAALA